MAARFQCSATVPLSEEARPEKVDDVLTAMTAADAIALEFQRTNQWMTDEHVATFLKEMDAPPDGGV